MAAGDTVEGRRRPDVPFGDLPDDVQPGDYWRYLDRQTGEPLHAPGSPESGNLTETAWGFCAPNEVDAIGTLMKHTVREHDDGTASIRAGDGSSNSVLIEGGGTSWHGYLEHGVWRAV